jgi:hypothetical protein
MQPCDSSIRELFDEAGNSLCSIGAGNGEGGDAVIVDNVAFWAGAFSVADFFSHPLILCPEALQLLLIMFFSGFDSCDETPDDGEELTA